MTNISSVCDGWRFTVVIIVVVVLTELTQCRSLDDGRPNYFQKTIRIPGAVSTKVQSAQITWPCENPSNDGFSFEPSSTVRAVYDRDPHVLFPELLGKLHTEDSLICHAAKLDQEEAYIIKYEPHASKKVAHHMMVYGCRRPGAATPYWSCGEMDDHSDTSVCGDGERQIVWAWAMDADSRQLPKDVGFRVGGSTSIQYIVIQLHYADKFQDGQTDNSGVTLHMTNIKQPFQAGYYVLYNTGYIPPMTQEFHSESACEFKKKYTIHPIGYRTHAHNLGVVSSGYRLRDGVWTEIGRMSPQLPQTFYNVSNPGMDVKPGDILAARCTMSSQRELKTDMGPRNQDEMCNFYILYYTDAAETLRIDYCMRDAQDFHWSDYLPAPPALASSTQGLPAFTRHDPYASPSLTNRELSVLM